MGFREKGISAVSFLHSGEYAKLKKSIIDCADGILQRYRDKGMNKTLRWGSGYSEW